MPHPSADPADFEEAVRWFRARIAMTDEDYEAAAEEARDRAFKVAGIAQLELVNDVWQEIERALRDGTTLEDFRQAVEEKLTSAWGADEPHRVETIFRTNVQTAYSAGRWEQMTDPAVKEARPFWRYSTVLDSRTTEICGQIAGTTLPADDPFWASHNPPLHFNCRSTIVTLTEEQAGDTVDEQPPSVQPQRGFGHAPDTGRDWEPDLSGYPPELVAVATAVLHRGEKASAE